MPHFEYDYDLNTLLLGKIEREDMSFSHEYGLKRQFNWRVKSMDVIVRIGENDIDLTNFLITNRRSFYERLKIRFLDAFVSQQTD